jgi:hypothetical protein
MVKTAASLGRLWARIQRFKCRPRQHPKADLRVADIAPSEPWLALVPSNVALSGVEHAVLLAQSLLVNSAVSTSPIDRRRLCLIVQHISLGATSWSPETLRFAVLVGVELALCPWDETNGTTMHSAIHELDGVYEEAKADRERRLQNEKAA